MKLLVTGALGLTGTAVVKVFQEKGWEVIGIDNNMRSYFFGVEPREAEYNLEIDIRDEKGIDNLFKEHKFDAIVHCAAQPSHDWAKKEPLTDFDINARGTLVLLEATRKHCPFATFVYVSTDKVYGENMTRDLDEDKTRWHSYSSFDEGLGLDLAGQRSLFGCSKLAGDLYVQEYGNYFGMKTACFRCGCITGKNHAGAEEHGFLAYLSKCIKEGKKYRIFGFKGKQVRDIIHAEDLANAFWHFIQHPRVAEVYNMGGGAERSVSILEAGDMIAKETGKKWRYEYVDEERRGDRMWDVHDVSKFREHHLYWDYDYSLDDIIRELCE